MPQYSDLEVRQFETYPPHDRNESTKEAIGKHSSFHPQFDQSTTWSQGNSQPVAHDGNAYWTCTLSKTKFYVVITIGILAIIGAIAGGVAGGLLSRHGGPENPAGSPDLDNSSIPDVNSNILSTSRLASSNWTDSVGVIHRVVFFQDPYKAIVSRRWDSQTKGWVTGNVTDRMRLAGASLNPASGSPLASAANSHLTGMKFEVYLWFLTVDDVVYGARLSHPDIFADKWENQPHTGMQTQPGSQLAAAWQRCWDDTCMGSWVVAYQMLGGDIIAVNTSNWEFPAKVLDHTGVADTSSLSLIPQLNEDGRDISMVLATESFSSGAAGSIIQTSSLFGGPWRTDGSLIAGLPSPSPRLQFATALGANFTQAMFLALLPNGTVTALWSGRDLTIPSLNFVGGPPVNFSAISTTEDAMLYGIYNDEILEYKPDDSDPSSFVYVGRVFP